MSGLWARLRRRADLADVLRGRLRLDDVGMSPLTYGERLWSAVLLHDGATWRSRRLVRRLARRT